MYLNRSIALLVFLLPTAVVPHAAAQATVVFHRGSTVAVPENTLMAMAWAVDAGAAIIEIDLRASADGHIVVMHDRRVDRTTNGAGDVHRMSLASLRSLDAGRGEIVPTLGEVLDFGRAHDVRLVLDVKDPDRVDLDELLGLIERHEMAGRVIVGSRSVRFIGAVRRSAPEIDLLAFTPDKASINEFLALDVEVVRLWSSWIRHSPELIDRVQKSGAAAWIDTRALDGPRLERIVGADIDGVITDRPLEALSYVSSVEVMTTD
jgi:glycerophosphoryl diester phosphodiesterase